MAIEIRSKQQIIGEMIAKIIADTDLNDVAVNSVLLTLVEAAASSDFQTEGKLLQLLNIRNIEKTTVADLEQIALEMGVVPSRIGSLPSRAKVTIKDSAFSKVSSNIYAGSSSPVSGDTSINIVDGSLFLPSGTLYIGRGSSSYESVSYLTIVNNGSYYTLNLSSPLTKDHLVGEEVVLAQGGERNIPSGTIVSVPAGSGSGSNFRTIISAKLLDGEDTIANIDATCSSPGSTGDVGKGKISQFTNPPFSTATVTNPDKATGGRDTETDAELRQRIKGHLHDLGKGTKTAIYNAIIGVSDPIEGKRVISAFLVEPTSTGQLGYLFIDDGTGFKPTFSGIGEEIIVTSAVGTEQFLQLQKWPLVKSQAASIGREPFALYGGENLLFEIDGISESHSIPSTYYRSPGSVTAQEIAQATNALFATVEARAKDGQLFVSPITDDPDYIRVGSVTNNANDSIKFPSRRNYTIRLYKNDKLLNKSGKLAILQSFKTSDWPTFASSETFQLEIDGVLGPLVTITDADFATLTSSVTINGASINDWIIVLNSKLIGVTASLNDDGSILITSNRGKAVNASVFIIAGTLINKLFAENGGSSGVGSDFKLNRLLGQIELATRMSSGENLKAGTVNTRAFFETTAVASFNLSLNTGSPGYMVIVPDGLTTAIPVLQSGSIVFSNPAPGTLRITGASSQFIKVLKDDYAFFYNTLRNPAGPTENGVLLKVKAIDTGSYAYVDFFDPNPSTGVTTIDGINKRISFFRTTDGIPQVFELPSGISVTNSDIITAFSQQISGAEAILQDGGAIRFQTTMFNSDKGMSIPIIAGPAANLGMLEDSVQSNDPHIASVESGDLLGYPSGKFLIQTPDTTNPYTSLDASGTPFNNNKYFNRPVLTYIGSAQNVLRQPADRPATDLLTLRNNIPFQNQGLGFDMSGTTTDGMEFGENDNIVFLIDDDAAKKTFDIPMYIEATVKGPSVPSTLQFDAQDSSAADFSSSSRWTSYDLGDYKVVTKSKKNLITQGPNTGIKAQAINFSENGKSIKVGVTYPSAPSIAPSASFGYDATNDFININMILGSGSERLIGLAPNIPIYVSYTGAGPYTYKVQFPPPVDLSTVFINDVCSLIDQTFSLSNRTTMRVSAISNLQDVSKTYQHLIEDKKCDISGGTTLTVGSVPSQTIRVGDKVVKKQQTAIVSAVGSNQITVPIASNFTAGPGTITVGVNSFTYTTYTSGTGIFAGVNPNPVGVVFTNDELRQSITQQTSYITGGTYPTFTISPSMTSGSAFAFDITHSSITVSSVPSFAPLADDRLIILGNNYKVLSVYSSTEIVIDTPFNFTGSQVGSLNRIYLGLTRTLPGTNENTLALSSQSLRIFEIDPVSNTAQALIDAANNTAGVNLLTLFSLPSGHDGTGILLQSTEDVLGTGVTHEFLQNGYSFVSARSNSSPSIQLKFPLDIALDIGEKVRLLPMTPKNVSDHLGKKQISGLSIAANINAINAGRKVQVNSKNSGGEGQVYAVGGRASGNTTLRIRNTTQELSGSRALMELDASAKEIMHPGHLVKISQTGSAKKKYTNGDPISSSTIAITIPTPGVGQLTFSRDFAKILTYTHTGSVIWIVRKITKDRVRYEVLSGTASLPAGLLSGDWVFIGDSKSYAGITPSVFFTTANQGLFQVVETDNSTYFDIDNSIALNEIITCTSNPFIFSPYHSAQVGDKIVLGADLPIATANKGTFTISSIEATNIIKYSNANVEVQTSIAIGSSATSAIYLLDQGYSTYRRVVMVLPKPSDPSSRCLVSVTPGYDMAMFSEAAIASLVMPNKLGFETQPIPGMNGYAYWTNLKQKAQYTLDGYAPDSSTYPGVKASGISIEVREPQIQQVVLSVRVKTKEGVALNSIQDTIKNAVVGYVNSLGLGQDVIISEIIKEIQVVPGVDAVVFLIPAPGTERIAVGDRSISRITSDGITLGT